jgi:hypothetical protein
MFRGRTPKLQIGTLSKNISKKGPLNRRSLHYAPPDFLLRVLALIQFMRFPLRETAPVVLASTASRKSGYAPVEMTKGRAVPLSTVVAEQEPFLITLGGPKAHDSSGWEN